MDNVNRWFNTYAGREARKLYQDEDEGIWQVNGEDPNCDWGGSHHNPNLGLYEGKFIDVVNVVVNLPQFWQWGAGGTITKTEIRKPIKLEDQERKRLLEVHKEYEKLGQQLRKAGMID